jgi:hypothetical protein
VAYFAGIGGQQAGPFNLAALGQKIQSGEISGETLVWRQGMSDWLKAKDVAELASLFQAPPPFPPK